MILYTYLICTGMTELNPHGSIGRRIATRKDYLANEKLKRLKKDSQEYKKIFDQLTDNQFRAGLLIPNIEAKIVNSDNYDKEMPNARFESEYANNAGELLLNGPSVTGKYYRLSADEAKGKFHNGYLISGDVAVCHESKQYIIRDRSKDMIKSGGEWISSSDLENKILDYFSGINKNLKSTSTNMHIKRQDNGVEMVCVVGAKHPKWDERPIVVLQMKPQGLNKYDNDKEKASMELLEQIREYLSQYYAKFQLPDDVVIWDKIPLTGTGKMSKKNVREKLDKEKYLLPSLRSDRQMSKL